jgi:transcriptional regulator with XRE-family HTH domain
VRGASTGPLRERTPGLPSVQPSRRGKTDTMDAANDIAQFLATRRARITPEQAGLPSYGMRRVPGLRREEVASLAGVSADYYRRLERGQVSGVSELVLEALARALQLDEAERAHLFDLTRAASPVVPKRSRPPRTRVRPVVQRLLDQIEAPAIVSTVHGDLLAANELGRALYAPVFDSPEQPANSARFTSWTGRLPPSIPTGTGWPRNSSRRCARRPAATRTTAASKTSSASCRRAATTSASAGRRTTCAFRPGRGCAASPASARHLAPPRRHSPTQHERTTGG